MTLNVKTDKGVELFQEFVQQADVVRKHFSVGTMARPGVSFSVEPQR
jgi:crotonobetainyl-CoA:carnitine CoA-transferase CaiB-like acyl-CoA transferase